MPKKDSIAQKILSWLEQCGKFGFPPDMIGDLINEPEEMVFSALKSLKRKKLVYLTGEGIHAQVFSSKFPKYRRPDFSWSPPYIPNLNPPPQLPRRTF